MNITVLCKVVDNYGDIGVAYRMVKQLKNVYETYKKNVAINLIVDDLVSFNKINADVSFNKDFQIINGINVYNWNNDELCTKDFLFNDGEKLEIILECFQCGRPEWMEKILFEKKLQRIVNIIMIDYLTAEAYADDFHCLQSLTRSAKVQKVNFMPGFTGKTGGLIIDENWKELVERNKEGKVLVFTYERNWQDLCNSFNKNKKQVMIARGRGFDSFVESWNKVKCNDELLEKLDYVNQEEWDELMKSSSALIIRGEESMSRACLSGIPFVWHAYPQSEGYQTVKVEALLNRMKFYFSTEEFKIIYNLWMGLNSGKENLEKDFDLFFENVNKLEKGYKNFALDIRKNGDLCYNLMTFIDKKYII